MPSSVCSGLIAPPGAVRQKFGANGKRFFFRPSGIARAVIKQISPGKDFAVDTTAFEQLTGTVAGGDMKDALQRSRTSHIPLPTGSA